MPPLSIRGAWPHGTIRANGSSLPLVLIERIAHVRGGGRAVASVKFFDETFLQKSFDLALALSGRQPEKKLGKQRSAFPGRRRTEKVASRKLGGEPAACPLRHDFGMTPPPKGEARLGSPLGGRYVPVGRCPAADQGGSRDAGTASAVTERASGQRLARSCPRAGNREMRQLPKKLGFMRV